MTILSYIIKSVIKLQVSEMVKVKEKQRRGVFLHNTQWSWGSLLNKKRCYSCHLQQKETHKIRMLSHPTHYLPSFPSMHPRATKAWQVAVIEHQTRTGLQPGLGAPRTGVHRRKQWRLLLIWGSPLSAALLFHPLRSHLPVLILSLTRPREAA